MRLVHGDLILSNHPDGGFVAIIDLPAEPLGSTPP